VSFSSVKPARKLERNRAVFRRDLEMKADRARDANPTITQLAKIYRNFASLIDIQQTQKRGHLKK
jgi:hypothetical protein